MSQGIFLAFVSPFLVFLIIAVIKMIEVSSHLHLKLYGTAYRTN